MQEKLDLRKKQFHLLVTSIHQMQDLLAEDEEEEAAKSGASCRVLGHWSPHT